MRDLSTAQAGPILLKIKRSRVFRTYKTSVTKITMKEKKNNIPKTKKYNY